MQGQGASDTPHYENVPFEVPEGWCWVKIRDLCYYIGGYAFKSTQYVASSDNQVIRIGNVKDDKILLESQPVFITDDYAVTAESALLKNNDLLFTMTGTKGKRDYFKTSLVRAGKKRLFLNQRVGCLRSYSTHVYMEYLCLAMKHTCVLDAIFQTETGNVSQGNIGSENTLDLLIPLPSLNEQKRIVQRFQDCISDIDSVELNTIELKKVIERLKSKILDFAIHGKLVPQDANDEPASELLKRINPKAIASCDNPQYGKIPSGWVWCKIEDIFKVVMGQSPNGDSVNHKFIGVEFHQGKLLFSQCIVEKSDVYTTSPTKLADKDSLLVCVRAPVGDVNITDREICIGRGLCALKPLSNLPLDYWFYAIKSLKAEFNKKATGSTFLAISALTIKNQVISLPPYQEQLRIVSKVNELFSQLDRIEKSLQA